MYERFYRLRERPFALTPDPDYLYPSRVHKEALSYLRYGIESHAGFVVITGAIGSGKTTLLQTMLRGLDGRTTVARVMNTLLDPRELIEAAMIDLGLDPEGKSKPAMLKTFGEFLVNERSGGRLVLLVIDEAKTCRCWHSRNGYPTRPEVEVDEIIRRTARSAKAGRPSSEQLRHRSHSYHLSAEGRHTTSTIGVRRWDAVEFADDRSTPGAGNTPDQRHRDATLATAKAMKSTRRSLRGITDLDATGVLGPRSNPNAELSPAELLEAG